MAKRRTIASLYNTFPEDFRDTTRIAATVTGFRQRFGHWPTVLRMDASQHRGIAAMLTGAAVSDLNRRVQVIPAPDFPGLVAEDGEGNQWSYGDNGLPSQLDGAYLWIWDIDPSHPKPNDHGKPVHITTPSIPTSPETWTNPDAVATVVPGGAVPVSLNGIPFTPWENPPTDLQEWDDVEGQNYDVHLDEPEFEGKPGKSRSAGVIVEEPDGRVWVVHPTNAFGGYKATFAKGGLEKLEPQAAAIKEAYEESGLKVEITGLVGDIERSTTVARYYLARRVGGTPSDMGWESQAVSLVPRAVLSKVLNQPVDHKLLVMLDAPIIPAA